MSEPIFDGSCLCSCGGVKLRVREPFITRFFCHCTICQSVYRKPFADVTVLRASQIDIDANETLQFHRLRPPPNINRGICSSCEKPSLGLMSLVPGLKVAFLPTHMFEDPGDAPDAAMHIFYHSRVEDVDDALPKHSGYWSSMLGTTGKIVSGLFA